MKVVHRQANRNIQMIVALINLVLLLWATWARPVWDTNWMLIFLLILSAGLLIQFPSRLLLDEITLIPVIALSAGFISGPVSTAWAIALGIFGGYLLRWFALEKRSWRRFLRAKTWVKIGFKISNITLPLILSFAILGPQNLSVVSQSKSIWLVVAPTVLLFVLLHGLIIIGGFLTQQNLAGYPKFGEELSILALIEGLIAIFVVIMIDLYWQTGPLALWLLGAITIVIAVLMHHINLGQTQKARLMRELSTIQHISQTLRSTLDLDELLPVIQKQLVQLLDVNNFYIAIYDRENEELWYPFAVKFGERRYWPRRSISNRLTERVIKEANPIILTPETQPILAPVGLPTSEASPVSWLGVPLISSERIIGCLAVFTTDPALSFTKADLDVLTLLSGQVSVAIENALLYQQTQQRACQLETLNQLTSAMTASLNLEEVLERVCRSVAQVVDSTRSAIFLTHPGSDTVSLAHSQGLGETFQANNASFSVAQSRRARCLRTGKPIIIPDLNSSSLPADLIRHYRGDPIQAVADFPLTTPDGQIGFLSVYFDAPHNFAAEETDILQTFASQAALAVANARLHAQTDAALARRVNQLTTLEAVGRELSAATNTEHLYNLILQYALEMTNSCCGVVAIYDPATKKIEAKASYGYQLEGKDLSVEGGILGQAVRTGKVSNIPDILRDASYADWRESDTRSQLSVPIIYESRILGSITVESTESGAYNESEESFVMQLANQAAIDIVNAELYQETQRRLREQSTLYQVVYRLVGARSPHEVSSTLTQAINAAIQPLAIGVYHWSESTQSFDLLGTTDEHLPESISQFAGLLEPVFKSDFHALSDDDPLNTFLAQYCTECKIWVFPLERTHKPLGLTVLHLPKEQALHENEIKLVQAILAQGSIALQNAHNFQDATNGRDRLAAVLNSIEEGILMVDLEGHILLANEPLRMLTGFSLAKFENTRLYDLPDESLKFIGYTQKEIRTLLSALRQKHVPSMPKTIIETHSTQSAHTIERFTTPIWGYDGLVIGWMLLLRDISEEREVEQAREAITATIVHDLRSPMSAIMSALDLITDCIDNSVEREKDEIVIRQSILVAQRSANRVLDLTDALLEIARMQSGRMELVSEALDLPGLIHELLFEFATRAKEDNVILQSKIPDEIPSVWADRNKLIRILTNLMDNAIKFTPPGEQVAILAEQITAEFVAVKVKDSGPGIPEEYRERIFEQFVQIPGQRTRRRGTGLGLTFCRLAVEAHGGRIWVDTPPEGGSIFTFTLPIASVAQITGSAGA